MKNILKRKIKLSTGLIFGFIMFLFGLTCLVYANTYNSSEISYNTAVSGSTASNVKDAIDDLYKKTKSGAFSECPENMSCVEKPGVVMNVTGPGTVDKGTVYVGIGENSTFKVTPDDGYTLHGISCNNDYTVSGFGVHPSDTTNAPNEQIVTIINPNTANGGTCTITFGAKYVDINVKQSVSNDSCNSNKSGCICYQIKNNISNFTYGSHTGCNFISKKCSGTGYGTVNCTHLKFSGGWLVQINADIYSANCEGKARCAT